MEKDSEVEEDEEDDENKRASRRAKHYSGTYLKYIKF